MDSTIVGRNKMSNNNSLPTHITDPFDFHESVTVGVTCAVFFAYLHYVIRQRYHYYVPGVVADNDNNSGGSGNNKNKKSTTATTAAKSTEQQKIDDEFGARIISWIHAVLSTAGSFYAMYSHVGGWFDAPIATRMQANWCMFSLAYFAVDTIVMFLTNNFDVTFFFHHLLAMSSLTLPAVFGIQGIIVCSAVLAGEVSNPFMHARWLFDANGTKRDSAIIKFLTRAWFVTFFVSRVLVCPWLFYYVVQVMHWAYWPQSGLMIFFSWLFIVDAWKKERKGEWWIG